MQATMSHRLQGWLFSQPGFQAEQVKAGRRDLKLTKVFCDYLHSVAHFQNNAGALAFHSVGDI